jgi:hypothetical protein
VFFGSNAAFAILLSSVKSHLNDGVKPSNGHFSCALSVTEYFQASGSFGRKAFVLVGHITVSNGYITLKKVSFQFEILASIKQGDP